MIALRTASVSKEYDIPPLKAVSTVGAGDNFNAGIIYGLLKYDVRYDDLNTIGEAKWDQIIRYGMEFAAEVCKATAIRCQTSLRRDANIEGLL
mgnify:CR=1 FL=1